MKEKPQEHWYVLVFTPSGPRYVTREGENRTCYWEETGVPKEMSKTHALQIVTGLLMNDYNANAVCVPIVLDRQPYDYRNYICEFREKKETQYSCQ